MNVQSISLASKAISFKSNNLEPKPIVNVENKKDDEIVMYSTWGGNYAFPVTAGDIKAAAEARKEFAAVEAQKGYEETPEEYYERKLFSPEWFM